VSSAFWPCSGFMLRAANKAGVCREGAKGAASPSTGSHVRQTVAMSQIFIARLQEIQRVHIPHSRCSHSIQKKAPNSGARWVF